MVNIKIGTKVKMVNCAEAEHPKYKDRIWKTRSNPWNLCGTEVVLLEGFSGGFATEYLQVVGDEEENENKMIEFCENMKSPEFGDLSAWIEWAEKLDDYPSGENKADYENNFNQYDLPLVSVEFVLEFLDQFIPDESDVKMFPYLKKQHELIIMIKEKLKELGD